MEFSEIKGDLTVAEITANEAMDMILNKHYLGRRPPISWVYGLFHKDILVGVCTIGKPASRPLCVGVCGVEYAPHVFELNRLFTEDWLPRNTESFFVGKVLKLLKPKDLILISYSDSTMGHNGYMYQATNFYYTGQSAKRTDTYNPKGTHPRDYKPLPEYAHLRRVRSVKNRYVYFCCSKGKKKEYLSHLKYPIIKEYPKGDNHYYEVGNTDYKQLVWNKKTDEYYYE